MKFILRQFKQILLTTGFALCVVTVFSQVKHKPVSKKALTKKTTGKKPVSGQLKDFLQLTAAANVVFTFPPGFKEIPVVNNEDFSFDYAMELPGREFELWLQVKSQKENWADYQRYKDDANRQLTNPDSLYIGMGQAHAKSFTEEESYVTRIIPPDVLARYNATAGKTYLLNLRDMPETKRYKYALLITLQKDHIGTILAVCFSNEKGAEFFKNINKVSKCLKFKP